MSSFIPSSSTEAAAKRCTEDVHYLVCVTQDPEDLALSPDPGAYLAVCTVRAVTVSTGRYCPSDECGGHPLCQPCYDLAVERGLVIP